MYLKGIGSGLEIMAPGLSCFYDGQHLFVMMRQPKVGTKDKPPHRALRGGER